MAANDGSISHSDKWATKDIVYLSIVGPVMLAAAFEWVLWLAAFIYCLIKVYQKADHWSIQVMAVVMLFLFSLLRLVFLPIMIVTLPLPPQLTRHIPRRMEEIFQWFAFWSFSVLLVGPWLACVHQLVTSSVRRTKSIKEALDDRTAPKTVVVMPVYKEEPDTLIKAIDSVVDCDYPAACIHVFLSWDGNFVDESYLRVIQHLGIPISLKSYPQSIDVVYKKARITVSRFTHGGKRHCQKQTFKLIDKVYAEYLKRHDDLFVLFIDSDCILDRVCLQNFMYDMELKPGSKHNMLAMTGIITSTTTKNSFITVLQDMEYIHGQLFERSVESACGAVTCLPGALTILRFSAFRKMAKYYFSDKAEQCDDLFDYGKCHLGEDRWLTHLFMIGAKAPYQIQMCADIQQLAKTAAPLVFGRYPLLCFVRFLQNTIRTTALLFFIMAIALITTSKQVDDIPVGFIGVSLGLNYLLMFYFGIRLGRYKAWLYPLMFIVNPFFNWLYMVYGIFTAGQRTWGGPRADAATADDQVTPSQAVELARELGNELNVDVDSFRANSVRRRSVPIRPSDNIDGQFAPAEQLLDGFYINTNEASPAQTRMSAPLPNIPRFHIPGQLRGSMESTFTESSDSGSNSILLPQTVESLMSEEDQRKLYYARQSRASTGMSIAESSDKAVVWPQVSQPIHDHPEFADVTSTTDLSGPHEPSQENQIQLETIRTKGKRTLPQTAISSDKYSRGAPFWETAGEMA
ncbi:hypothetical protein N7450_008821 [Penicillium hetheringtonii]|uniref:chitin synthase n=1 Tax=Penicillium hetheringtonii TaxID=911720 RepID=A0AAD6DDY5_9EURO|nr:hypothetical protein N7450_008821 [Penicillium hetheringtonii]